MQSWRGWQRAVELREPDLQMPPPHTEQSKTHRRVRLGLERGKRRCIGPGYGSGYC